MKLQILLIGRANKTLRGGGDLNQKLKPFCLKNVTNESRLLSKLVLLKLVTDGSFGRRIFESFQKKQKKNSHFTPFGPNFPHFFSHLKQLAVSWKPCSWRIEMPSIFSLSFACRSSSKHEVFFWGLNFLSDLAKRDWRPSILSLPPRLRHCGP